MPASNPPAREHAYVGVGSNLDDPLHHVRDAISGLDRLPATRLVSRSSLYRTKAVGPVEQPDFINAVVCLETLLAPRALLAELQAVEAAHGRRRDGIRWGPRPLDLDILLYGSLRLDDGGLIIPHPRITERAFVLTPLLEIAPALIIPGGPPIAELAALASSHGVAMLEPGE